MLALKNKENLEKDLDNSEFSILYYLSYSAFCYMLHVSYLILLVVHSILLWVPYSVTSAEKQSDSK